MHTDIIYMLPHPEWTFGLILLALMAAFIALTSDT